MAQDREPHIWSCSTNGNIYYSTLSNPDWQNICAGMLFISAGHSGVVFAIDNEGVINIRVGISDAKPYGIGWTSLFCEGKHIVIGSRKVVRITKENEIFAAILPEVISKNVYLSWYVVNINKDSISKSDLLSLDVNDNLYIASKSGDIFVYVEDQLAMEQSFWKLIVTGPKIPQGLISRLKSFASLGLLSDENNNNVDVCSFLVGEKFMWLIRKNSKEIYQLEFDHSVEEPINSWNRFRLDSKWTINCICGCKDSMIWAITDDGKLVTVTCTPKSVSVKECSIPSLTSEDYSKFRWTSVSIGYNRQVASQLLLENKESTIGNARIPPSTLSLYPSLSEHESELTSNGSMQRSGECCDDGSCNFCMDQKQRTLDDSLSPVQISLQKKGYSLFHSPGTKFGIKRKADFSNSSDPICNERIILKAKRRKIKSQLPKLKSLEGIKVSLFQKLKKSNQYLMKYNPKTLQAAKYSTFKADADEKLFDFNLEEEYLSGEEPVPMSVPCSDDTEQFRLNSLVNNNNDTEAFEFSLPTSRSMSSLPQMHSIGMCTSVTPTNEILSSPVQESCLEEYVLQPAEESSVPLSSLPMVSSPSAPLTEVHNGAIHSATQGPPPPPPPPPPIPFQQKLDSIESHNDIFEEEEVEFKAADSSSDEIMEEQFSLH